MIGNDANIRAVITAKDEASATLKAFGNEASSTGDKVAGALKAAAVVGVAATAAAVAFGVSSVKAFQESQNVLSQLDTVLRSTGGAAGVTKDSVIALSKQLEHLTGVSDEAVINTENVLLTFTSIGKKVFPDATKAVLDMATSLNHGAIPSMEDMQAKAILVGKALQDPDAGLGALHRVGVNVDELKKKFTASMSVQDKQILILKELQTEFGGSAEAAGKTFAGAMNKLKQNFNDFQEVVGGTITQYLAPFITKAADAIAAVDWDRVMQQTIRSLKDFHAWLIPVIADLERASTQIETFLKPAFLAMSDAIRNDLIPAFQNLYQNVLLPLRPLIQLLVEGIVLEIRAWMDIENVLIQVTSGVINIFVRLFEFVTKTLVPAMEGAFNFLVQKALWVKDNFFIIVGSIIGFFVTLPILMPFYVAAALTKIVQLAVSVKWSDVFAGIWQAMQAIWDRVTGAAVNAYHYIFNLPWGAIFSRIGRDVGNAIIDLIQGAINGAFSHIPGHPHVSLPHFASGVTNFSGGLAVVGERGAEVVNLPKGADVIPNNKLQPSLHNQANINININAGVFMGSDVEARKAAQVILGHIKDIGAAKNMSVNQMLGI